MRLVCPYCRGLEQDEPRQGPRWVMGGLTNGRRAALGRGDLLRVGGWPRGGEIVEICRQAGPVEPAGGESAILVIRDPAQWGSIVWGALSEGRSGDRPVRDRPYSLSPRRGP